MSSPNQVTLVNKTIPAAGTYVTDAYYVGKEADYLATQVNFVRDAGGTSLKAYIQTSFDDENWADIMCFAFTTTTARKVQAVTLATALAANITPTDGTLTDNTILSGLLGLKIRVKYVVVGTYTGVSTIRIDMVLR
jgi:hypothetical protein